MPLKQRLFKSFFLSAVAVFLICITVFAALLYVNMNDVTRQNLDVQAKLAAQTVQTGGLEALEQLSLEDCRIRWLSADGEVLYDSAPQLHTAVTQQVPLEDGSALEVSNVGYTLFQLLLQSFTPLLFVAALAAVLSTLLATRAAKALTEPLNRIDFIHPDERDVDEELKPLVRRLAEQNRQILSQMEDLGREHDRQDRLRREFTANVSHELKTPLTSINGFAELIRDGLVRPEDVQRFAGKICDEARRLMDLVGDILRLSRLEERGRDLAMEPLSLRAWPCAAASPSPWPGARGRSSPRRKSWRRSSIISPTTPYNITDPAAASPSPSARARTPPPWPSRTPASAFPRRSCPAFLSASTGWTKATPGSWAALAWGSPSSSTARSAWAPSSVWRATWASAPPSPCSSPRQERSNPLDTL